MRAEVSTLREQLAAAVAATEAAAAAGDEARRRAEDAAAAAAEDAKAHLEGVSRAACGDEIADEEFQQAQQLTQTQVGALSAQVPRPASSFLLHHHHGSAPILTSLLPGRRSSPRCKIGSRSARAEGGRRRDRAPQAPDERKRRDGAADCPTSQRHGQPSPSPTSLCLPPLQVRRTYEEMKYFKMELQNREENFNSTFKSQPRVGTLNPLAGKASASSKDLSAATHALRGGDLAVSQLAAGALRLPAPSAASATAAAAPPRRRRRAPSRGGGGARATAPRSRRRATRRR